MKKYFMKGTEDELQFGDMIELDFTKDTEDGVKHCHMECKFLEELVPMLLENDIIEVVEDDDKEDMGEDFYKVFAEYLETQNSIDREILKKIENLQEEVAKLKAQQKKVNRVKIKDAERK